MGVSRKKIPWKPIIDHERCNLCDEDPQCLKFCPHNVFKVEKNPLKLIVKNPHNCVVFCRSCRKVCATEAINFPKKREILKIIKENRGY